MKKKYEIIIEYIEELAEKNELKQGQRLPPIRTLVDKFECNKSTIIRAYKELEMNHRIYSFLRVGIILWKIILKRMKKMAVLIFL